MDPNSPPSDSARVTRRGLLRGLVGAPSEISQQRQDELSSLTIAEAGRLMAGGDVSPLEIMKAILARAERIEPLVNAFAATLDADQCLDQARRAEAEIQGGGYRGRLHGIPLAVKDTHETVDMPTAAGTPLRHRYMAQADATVVARLKAAGALVVAKTRLPEWSFGAATPGTHNPWALERDPGGSSGGSAAAVAADLVSGATGGDTGGSIRSPALACGVVGLKPTYGRVPLRGIVPIAWSLDHVGPLAKTVEDAALILNVIAGHDPQDRTSAQVPVPIFNARLRSGVRGWTIGVPEAHNFHDFSSESMAAFECALQVFREQGASVREVVLPASFTAAHASQRLIRIVEAAAYHRQFLRAGSDYGPGSTVRPQVLAGSLLPAVLYQRALMHRSRFIAEMRQFFSSIDVFVTPGWHAGGDPRGFPGAPALSSMWNLCGFPAIVLPAGFTSTSPGLPLGIQIAGRPWEEETILTAATSFERSTDWHLRRPPRTD